MALGQSKTSELLCSSLDLIIEDFRMEQASYDGFNTHRFCDDRIIQDFPQRQRRSDV